MSTYETMSYHLETERLILRPWAESDAAEFRALLSERGNGTPTVERTRASIAELLTATATTGIALLPIQRRDEGDFIGYCGLIIGRSTVEEPEIAYERDRVCSGRAGGLTAVVAGS
jgi:RimJ/RimL family protein N-acetyltransferase